MDTSNDRVDKYETQVVEYLVSSCAGPYLSYRYSIGTNNIQLFSSPSTKLTKPETAILSSVSVWSGAVSQGVARAPQGYPPLADAEVQVAGGALLSMVDT